MSTSMRSRIAGKCCPAIERRVLGEELRVVRPRAVDVGRREHDHLGHAVAGAGVEQARGALHVPRVVLGLALRGSCMTPMWMSAVTSPARKTSRAFLRAQVDLDVLDVARPPGKLAAIDADDAPVALAMQPPRDQAAEPAGDAGDDDLVALRPRPFAASRRHRAHQKMCFRSLRPIADHALDLVAHVLAPSPRAPRPRRRDRRRSAAARRSRCGTSSGTAGSGKNGGSGISGNAGAPISFASGFRFTAGACSSAPMTAIGTIGVPGLEREPHEAEAELLQLVALRERLRDALGALGKDQDRLFVLEQAAAVLGRAGDLPPAREQVRDERQRLDVLLDHGAHDARRIVLEEQRAADADARRTGSCPEWLETSSTRPLRDASRCRAPRRGSSSGRRSARPARRPWRRRG